MQKDIALVLDTNFVYAEASQMDDLLQQLSEKYEVYITQISIDERKEQRCREFNKRYIEFQQFCQDFRYLFTIDKEINCTEAQDKLRSGMQTKYELSFPEHIIPFEASKHLLEKVVERANRKYPPFIADEKASDKGFKDTLIWLSMLEYFKIHGPNEVIFLTSDNGFKKDTDTLCREFTDYTNKNITINDNGYYTSLLKAESEKQVQTQKSVLPEVNQLREKIHEVVKSLCFVESEDYWGDTVADKTFSLSQKVDGDYMEILFAHLKQEIADNLFEKEISAEKILELDNRITNGAPIPISALENVLSLYEEIKKKMPEFLPQFFNAAANVINTNFVEPQETLPDDDDLPF